MSIQTDSVMLQNLCVPCGCRCRYCLLSWDGRPVGTTWERGTAYAERFRDWALARRPALRVSYTFGYSMEHPDLKAALRTLRRFGSPQAEFLQCDGLRLRDARETRALAELLAGEGVKKLNFTVYGLPAYHDRFAGRAGDFDNLLRLMTAAGEAGLGISAGIPLTLENVGQIGELLALLRERADPQSIFLFVPHEEGRGVLLDKLRITRRALDTLPPEALALLNRRLYRPEGEWIRTGDFVPETKRTLLISLRADTIDRCEGMEPAALIRELEALDDAYYAAYPSLEELADRYGDPDGQGLYRQRDLFYHYRRLYAAEHPTSVYDVTDERQSGSRRA